LLSDLPKTWNDVAAHWDDWGPPLRPCPHDLRIMRQALCSWQDRCKAAAGAPVRAFLHGVTPEIAMMDWPFAVRLTAMDQSRTMVERVWPGDIDNVRRAVVGNWLQAGIADHSQQIVINDGIFTFFRYPDRLREMVAAIRRLLSGGGLLVCRHFAQIDSREPLQRVIDDAQQGRIGNFHVFKWRLAMALQSSSAQGVSQREVWQAWTDAAIDLRHLPQPGWSPRTVNTINFYRDKHARLHFATLEELCGILAGEFADITVNYADYELGERCPIISARPI
jgi:hypothetical protein